MRTYKKYIPLVALGAIVIGLAFPARAEAQRRFYPRSHVVVVGGFYDPFWFYDPWFGWGYPYGYAAYPPYPYRYYGYDNSASLRLDVKPKQAEVYVDGYYAGIVDDYDGIFQRLSVQPGEHEIELYLEGYRTARQKLYLTPRNTFKLKYTMERLQSGEQPEPRPEPINPPPSAAGGPGPGQPPMPGMPPRGPVGRRMPPNAPPMPMPGPGEERGARARSDAYGSISIRVQPGDADVLIDGERWNGPAGQERLTVDVPEGRHTIEIQKSGFRTYVTDVEVRSGQTTTLNVSLRSQDEH